MSTKGFILQSGYIGKEELAISSHCILNQIPLRKESDPSKIPHDYIPCGSVEWCQMILGSDIIPNYYPEFLSEYLYRKVWQTDEWPLGKKLFIKPSDKYKRFTGFVTNGGYRGKKRGPYWCSEVISFDNEWRYYIADGKVLSGEWYSGDEINVPDAPSIDHIDIPEEFCGAVDFGMVNDKLTLVEANHPFACGWYGTEHSIYAKWLEAGWKYMKNFENKII
jgi:hypothetical protein